MALIKQKDSREKATSRSQPVRPCGSLILDLDDEDPSVRRWAARDLLSCKNQAALAGDGSGGIEGVAAALVCCLKNEPDRSVREVILTTLTRLGDAQAVAGLVDCLRSEDAALRNEAIEAMKQLPNEVAPIMHGLLSDADPDVRIFTVNVLESLRHPQVESWLIDVINTDAHVNVCATAVDLLSELASNAALLPLQKLKRRFSDEPYLQFAVDLAISRIHQD